MYVPYNESDDDALDVDLEEDELQRDLKDVSAFLVGLVRKGVAKAHIVDTAKVLNRFFQTHLPASPFPNTWHLLQKNASVAIDEVGHRFVLMCEGCGHYTQEPEGYTSQTGAHATTSYSMHVYS